MNLNDDLNSLATTCFNFFNSWVKAGFTEDQAMRMVILMMVEMYKDNKPDYGLEID